MHIINGVGSLVDSIRASFVRTALWGPHGAIAIKGKVRGVGSNIGLSI